MRSTSVLRSLAATLGLASFVSGQDAFLVKDINPNPGDDAGSSPEFLLTIGTTTFLTAYHVEYGLELWKTDTTGTPVLVRDINPFGGSDPDDLTDVDGTLFFTAFTPSAGRELWKSDGTETGTVLVADITPGGLDSNPTDLVNLDGTLVFAAWASGMGRELWVSDGTAGGTTPVVDLNPGSAWSNPQELTTFDGRVYFRATDGVVGHELWSTDGTASGTELVLDLVPGSGAGVPAHLTVAGGRLYFAAESADGVEPWSSDGTAAGTSLLADLVPAGDSSPWSFVTSGGWVYFSAAAPAPALGRELWKTDGTAVGTEMVDVVPVGSPSPDHVTPFQGGVVFRASSTQELWFTDGTPGGAELVFSAAPFDGISDVVSTGSEILFLSGPAPFPGNKLLYKWNGSPVGAVPLLPPSTEAGDRLHFDGSVAWFGAGDPFPHEPWTTDGTAGGTAPNSDLNPGAGMGSSPHQLHALRDRIYFLANDGAGFGVWVSDGTVAGTRLAVDPPPWTGPIRILSTTNHVFVVDSNALWVTDATPEGTILLGADFDPAHAVEYDGFVYFDAGTQLWRTDGTVAGTELFFDAPGAGPFLPVPLAELQGRLFFTAWSADFGYEIWSTDGTLPGTTMFLDVAPGPADGFSNTVEAVATTERLFVGSQSFFGGVDGLWTTSGTPAGSEWLAGVDVHELVGVSDGVFFRDSNGSSPRLWWSDGTVAGTFVVPGAPPPLSRMAATKDALFFWEKSGAGLWKCGTAPVVAELMGELGGHGHNHLLAATTTDSRVLFSFEDEEFVEELWLSDGTPAGTQLFQDLSQTSFGSDPANAVRAGEYVFFTAEAHLGQELYAVRVLETGGYVAEPFGSGCAGSSGVVPRAYADLPAVAGETFAVRLADARPGSVALLLHSFGPLDTTLGDCTLLLGLPFEVTGVVATDAGGEGAFAFPIPPAWGLLGVPLYLQYLVADPGGAFEGVASFSNGLEVIAGP